MVRGPAACIQQESYLSIRKIGSTDISSSFQRAFPGSLIHWCRGLVLSWYGVGRDSSPHSKCHFNCPGFRPLKTSVPSPLPPTRVLEKVHIQELQSHTVHSGTSERSHVPKAFPKVWGLLRFPLNHLPESALSACAGTERVSRRSVEAAPLRYVSVKTWTTFWV